MNMFFPSGTFTVLDSATFLVPPEHTKSKWKEKARTSFFLSIPFALPRCPFVQWDDTSVLRFDRKGRTETQRYLLFDTHSRRCPFLSLSPRAALTDNIGAFTSLSWKWLVRRERSVSQGGSGPLVRCHEKSSNNTVNAHLSIETS